MVTPVASTSQTAPAAATAPAPTRSKARAATAPKRNGKPRLFVLDTNVLMHDPMSLFRFEEHDVFLPMITLEELDGHKKGMSEVARSVRQVSRELDAQLQAAQEIDAQIARSLQPWRGGQASRTCGLVLQLISGHECS